MIGWFPWERRRVEAARQAARIKAHEAERVQYEGLRAEVAAFPYRIVERADGLWRVEYAYVWWWLRGPPSIHWKVARHCTRLPTRDAALEAVKRLLNPVEVRVDASGCEAAA
jgi:hypothetical protein